MLTILIKISCPWDHYLVPLLFNIYICDLFFENCDIHIANLSNAEKSHLIVSAKENLEIQVSSCSTKNEDSVKLLGIHNNNNLNFDCHVNQLCKKAHKKGT